MDDFKKLLKSNKLSQRELAEAFEVAPQTVNRWATGKQEVPKTVLLYLALLLKFTELKALYRGEFGLD